ncbi:MAG: hypothetical protein KDA97_14665, partial [Acidimicrobiales bacterium]|nr:hypothetical protein [Acidimicrobiales bacterium]
DPLTGPVGFDVLNVGDAGRLPPWGKATVARTSGEVAQMWADAGLDAPSPRIDPDEQVVIAMTIADDACPPTLEGFVRDGTTIEPLFVDREEACEEPLLGHTYLVAIDWATVGDAFTFRLPAQPLADLPEVKREVERLPAEPAVEVSWELDETTPAAGDPLSGTVTVENRSGAPIEGTTCGDFFAVRLRGPDAEQVVARLACAQRFVIPEGRSSYDLTGTTTHTSCTTMADPPPDALVCEPDGSIPALPDGTYEALLDQGGTALVPPPDPIEVTIT